MVMMPFGRADLLYFNDFGTTAISGVTYTGTPTLATGISSAVWTTSVAAGFTSFAGSSGQALSLNNSGGTPTITLTLTLDNNYTLDLEDFSFWRQRSTAGAQNWTFSVLSTQVGSGSVTTGGSSTGTQIPTTTAFGGTEGLNIYTFSFGLSGATTTGTFRLDDFTLNGTLTLAAGAPATLWDGTGAAGTWQNGVTGQFAGNYANDLANTVTFTGTGGTVNAAGTPQAGSLTFSADAYDITGAVQLGVGDVDVANGAHTATISADISGSGSSGLTKSGNGVLVLSGNNSFTGATSVSSGKVEIQSANALGATAGSTTVADGATLAISGSVVTAAEAVTLNGSGLNSEGALRNESGSNTYSGAVTLANSVLITSAAGQLTMSGGISGTGQVLTVSGAGDTVISSSGLNTSTGGQLVKEGAGELTVSAAGNFTGGTTVNGGDLRVNATGALGSGAVNLSQPGVSLLTGNGVSLSNDINVAAYVGYGEGGSFIISEYIEGSSNNKYIELFNGTAEAINLGDYRVVLFANGDASPTGTQNLGALTGGPATLAAGQTLVLKNSAASLGLPVGVTGFNSAVANFNGDDALALQSADGSVNYDIFGVIGDRSVWTAGDLSTENQTLTRDGSVLTGVTVNPSGTGPSAFTTLGTQWTGYPIDTVSNLGSHKMNLGSGVAIVGSDVAGASVTYAGSVNLATTAQLTAASEGLTTFSGVLSGSAGITKTGAGTVTLAGNNTFTGGVAINDGALSVGADNNLGGANGAINLGGGTLAITETFTLGSGRLVTLATDTTSTLSVGDTKTLTFDGDFTGAGALDKTGIGRLSLSGSSSYTGATTVSAGELALSGGSIASSAVTVASGASLSGYGSVGTIGGAGAINPGNSPGILTTPQVDPSAGTDFNFEMTGTAPTYNNAASSVNDVIRITGATPFSQALAGGNELNLYFSGAALFTGSTAVQYQGGFFTDQSASFASSISSAAFSYYFANASGSTVYNGLNYYTRNEYETLVLSTNMLITISTVAQTANFDSGDINGQVMQVQVIPEPSTYALLGLSAVALGAYQWRRRRRG